jgi:hypothetical protein
VHHVRERRVEAAPTQPFEVVVQGSTPPDPVAAGDIARPYADAGATWWIDADWEHASPSSLLARIVAGPPRVS